MSLRQLRSARTIDATSALVALLLTIAAFASVLVVSARTLLLRSATPRVAAAPSRETLVFLERASNTTSPQELPSRTASSRTAAAKTAAPSSTPSARKDVDRAIEESSASPKGLAAPEAIFLPPFRPQARSTPSPFDAPHVRNPFLSEQPRTRAEQDSILVELQHGIPLFAKTRTPTPAERDSVMRDQARARIVPGREAQVPGTAQMSISVPLFSAGPSRAERRRDSSANAEYVARLRRLQARVSASRESLRVADSMARRRTP